MRLLWLKTLSLTLVGPEPMLPIEMVLKDYHLSLVEVHTPHQIHRLDYSDEAIRASFQQTARTLLAVRDYLVTQVLAARRQVVWFACLEKRLRTAIWEYLLRVTPKFQGEFLLTDLPTQQ